MESAFYIELEASSGPRQGISVAPESLRGRYVFPLLHSRVSKSHVDLYTARHPMHPSLDSIGGLARPPLEVVYHDMGHPEGAAVHLAND